MKLYLGVLVVYNLKKDNPGPVNIKEDNPGPVNIEEDNLRFNILCVLTHGSC